MHIQTRRVVSVTFDQGTALLTRLNGDDGALPLRFGKLENKATRTQNTLTSLPDPSSALRLTEQRKRT